MQLTHATPSVRAVYPTPPANLTDTQTTTATTTPQPPANGLPGNIPASTLAGPSPDSVMLSLSPQAMATKWANEVGGPALAQAIALGHLARVEDTIACSPGLVNWRIDGYTPLHEAVKSEDLDMAELLLTHPDIEIDSLSRKRVSPLLLAVKSSDLEMAQLLFHHKAAINETDAQGRSPLHAACRAHDLDTVQWLLAQPEIRQQNGRTLDMPSVLNQTGLAGKSPLHSAFHKSEKATAVAKFLLQQPGIDVTAVDADGKTLLCHAAQRGLTDILMLLLAHPDMRGQAGSTLHGAAFPGAIAKGRLVVAQLLLAHGADVRRPNSFGDTPFRLACASGKVEVVQWLLQQLLQSHADASPRVLSALLNEASKNGVAPLHEAAYAGHVQVVRFLLGQTGIDPNPISPMLGTPLHIAAAEGAYGVATELLKHRDIAIDQTDAQGNTALHVAVEQGEIGVVELLLDHGANINLRSVKGYTPLQVACETGAVGIARDLVRRPGIRLLNGKPRDMHTVLNQATSSGETLLHLAARRGGVDVVRFLLSQEGIDPTREDAKGETPLETAKRHEHVDVVRLLLAHRPIGMPHTS
ncbi:ankyrin repeat domain-containing protein [Hydrogenophaga sp.]|uniref:ankyrin repeat domain-containing protein n=1 Tax=Hydrogenophaga sp. TaxID=1904254 RepID=UPI002715FEBF|nr:ankyrin repeat domain-containing protein [Hydrogenophaga sp.]MDO9434982.1 ankyrin repeat domain-containing protein [Hydrogenophaga sp.]